MSLGQLFDHAMIDGQLRPVEVFNALMAPFFPSHHERRLHIFP